MIIMREWEGESQQRRAFIKKNQMEMEVLEWRNTIHETKNSLGRFTGRSQMAKERVSKIQYGSREIIQSEQQRKKWRLKKHLIYM